jgi:hypothetical protein
MMTADETTMRVRRFFAVARGMGIPREALIQEFIRGVGCARFSAYRWIQGAVEVSNAYIPRVKQTLARLEKKYEIPLD